MVIIVLGLRPSTPYIRLVISGLRPLIIALYVGPAAQHNALHFNYITPNNMGQGPILCVLILGPGAPILLTILGRKAQYYV